MAVSSINSITEDSFTASCLTGDDGSFDAGIVCWLEGFSFSIFGWTMCLGGLALSKSSKSSTSILISLESSSACWIVTLRKQKDFLRLAFWFYVS